MHVCSVLPSNAIFLLNILHEISSSTVDYLFGYGQQVREGTCNIDRWSGLRVGADMSRIAHQ